MSKPTRPRQSSARPHGTTRTFFVTSATWERRSLFRSERMAKLFLDVLFSYRTQGRYMVHEFVVMPDHFHLLISVPPRVTVERAGQLVKGRFSYRAQRELGFHSEIWQRGFADEYVTDATGYEAHRQYIHHNPVRAGLAREAAAYPYSSAHPRFEVDPRPNHIRG